MVVCTVTMPPEMRQQTPQMKEPPGLIDGPVIADSGGQGQGGVEEDDREEGEIVDDFELIISSEDEEFKLRARIQQLEENNKDVERMDMLSANLANQYNYSKPVERVSRYPHKSPIYVLSDVSSQSENEFEEQRKYRRHKIRRLEVANGKRHPRAASGGDYRRNPFTRRTKHKQLSPSPPPLSHRRRQRHNYHQQSHFHQQQQQQHHNYAHHQQVDISLDSLDSITDGEYDENDENADDELADLERLKLSRDKLRVALALEERQEERGQYRNSLRERLQYRMRKSPSPQYRKEYPRENELQLLPPLQALSDAEEEEEEEDEPEPTEPEPPHEDPAELRLRLIALKSAILKKHLARKKRDAERAYSPTDMINRVHPATSNDDDIDDLMEISPAASPERIPSPPRYSIDDAVDTKPVDMELAETDSDDQHNVWDPWSNNNWNSMDNAGGSWRCFMPNSLPPVSMPIVIDEEDDEEDQFKRGRGSFHVFNDDEEVPPPPPPFHIPQMHLEDEDARDAMHLVDQHSNHSSVTNMQCVSMENSQTHTRSLDKSQPVSSDDEAGALRAMLLSNLRPNRVPLPPPPPPAESPPPPGVFPALPATVPVPVPAPAQVKGDLDPASDSDDPEELRSLLLSSIATKKRVSEPKSRSATSPLILKNAVRRFLPLKDEEPSEEQEQEQALEEDMAEPKANEEQRVPEDSTEPKADEIIAEPSIREASPIGVPLVSIESPQHHVVIPVAKPASSPSTKIIKIVKPNKVINKMTTTKRKLPVDEQSASSLSIKRPTTLMIKEPSAPLHRQSVNSSSTRLITTMDPASIKVSKLIISLAEEESAASDDDLELGSRFAYANYPDIASPLSLAMGGGSPSGSTTRSNTPISEIVETAPSDNGNLRRTMITEYFEKKIDDFLKQARSKAPSTSTSPVNGKVPEIPKANEKQQQPAVTTPKTPLTPKITPVAVRHLPVSSQKEYLRLVERMQMLEKKKSLAPKASPLVSKASSVAKPLTKNGVHQPAKASGKPLEAKASPQKTKQSQPQRESRLKAFENSFAKIGASMISNLDRSLQMVEEAKKSKVIRMRCSQRLKELYAEMQSVKQSARQEELKLAQIQPEIQASHEIIISLKQKRHKLHAAALDLGRGLRGDDYRLRDDGKVDISHKSKQLTREIRLYNSIVKYDDLSKLTEAEKEVEAVAEEKEKEKGSQPQTVIENGGASEPAKQPSEFQDTPSPCEPRALEEPTAIQAAPKAVEPPDAPAQDEAKRAPKKGPPGARYTITTMRELRPGPGPSRSHYLPAYQSPISRNFCSHLDVHATICPFDLMGRCEDADCSYLHLARPDAPSELPKPTASQLSPNN